MTKKSRNSQRSVKKVRQNRVPIAVDDEVDNIYDEVDKFHKEYEDNLLKLVGKPIKPIAKEVLRIASDDESETEYIDENSDEEEEEEDSSTNKWGKKRKSYYGASYIDKDFGGVNDSEEEELLQMEEEDAKRRQQKLESANSLLNFDHFVRGSETREVGTAKSLANILKIGEIETMASSPNPNHEEDEEPTILDDKFSNSDGEEILLENETVFDENADHRDRRRITYQIRKNKGIRKDKGRKKGKTHSRVVKRLQYKKALIKRRSQVPDVRKEMAQYDGEKRGIRSTTIRSIKF